MPSQAWPRPTWALLCCLGVLPQNVLAQSGRASCPCIKNIITEPSLSAISQYREGDKLVFTPSGSTTKHYYPLTYGSGVCSAFDDGLPPSCSGSVRPGWCGAEWCYVNPDNCEGVKKMGTQLFFSVENLYFSYETCAGAGVSTNSVDQWTEKDVQVAQNVIQLIEDYGRSSRFVLEDIFANYNSTESCSTEGRDMCPCTGCARSTLWQNSMDFLDTGYIAGDSGTDDEQERAACLSSGVSGTYKTAAAKEADSSRRVGYLYFGDQATGGYTSWPREEFCSAKSTGWDPRARPWYAAGATGPKDVIIIADVSGSMGNRDRHLFAKKAVMRILDTMTWKDFATIILFNDGVKAAYSAELVAMTDQNRLAMKSWCESQIWRGGGTNFEKPLTRAFEILARSVSKGETSMCQKVIMFLTDGQDPSYGSDSHYSELSTQATKYDVFMFTYSLGSDADISKVKRMACENRGVFYPVPDGADLAAVMTDYYEYFAHGQEMCSASFVSYTSATGGQTLVAGCMAAYDRTRSTPDLLGVTCMDTGMITDVAAWRTQPGWNFFACTASDMTKQCRQVDLAECHRQKIRAAYSRKSVCDLTSEQRRYSTVTQDTVCPCRDPGCQDDPDFTDELGYFCDTWVGDDCENIDPSWGYSQAGLAEAREKCPRSCGRCDWSKGACGRTTSLECPVIPIATECRACVGRTSGVDIDQQPMACPRGAPTGTSGLQTNPPNVSASVAASPTLPFALAMAVAASAW